MPDYEFFCRRCKRVFTARMSVKAHDEKVHECPECHKDDQVDRRIAQVNVVTSRKS